MVHLTCGVVSAVSHGKIKVIDNLVREQDPPKPSKGDVWLLVLRDMEERRLHGIEKYGLPVQLFNGRDSLVDAYQEALDLCVYLRQAIEERQSRIECNKVRSLVIEIRKYVLHHGVMIGECVAWEELKRITNVGQDSNCPSEEESR